MLYHRMNTEFTIIKSQHEKTMLDMNKMIQSIIGSMQYSKELIEDNYSYRWVSDTTETPELGRECFCPFRTLNKSKGSGFMLSYFYPGTLPWGKGLGFVPLRLRLPKCEYCPRPFSLYSSKFRIFCIKTISTMLGISSNPEFLGFWQQITRSGIHDKNGKSLYLLGLLSP